MRDGSSHCRLCAEPSVRSRLVCMDDEVIDIKEKMLLINVDVSAPSPLPRGVCYSCLCLLERTCTFLHQVSSAQRKLAQIYQDNKDLVDIADNMNRGFDFDFSVKEELSDDERAEIKIEPCGDELPEKTQPANIKRKSGRKHKEVISNIVKDQKLDINIQKPPPGLNKKRGRPRKECQSTKKKDKKDIEWGVYLCKCSKTFQSPGLLRKHKKIHSDRTRDYFCHTCGKGFFDRVGLLGHMVIHKAKRFICDVCGKSFSFQKQLKRHATQHSSKRPFECDQCDKTFAQKRLLKRHSAVHLDIRPHVCSYCDKGFKMRKTLLIHIRSHTGVKPYCCEFCGKEDHDQANHYKHVRMVHGGDPIKPKNPDIDKSDKNDID